jgi:hypothetical protein
MSFVLLQRNLISDRLARIAVGMDVEPADKFAERLHVLVRGEGDVDVPVSVIPAVPFLSRVRTYRGLR